MLYLILLFYFQSLISENKALHCPYSRLLCSIFLSLHILRCVCLKIYAHLETLTIPTDDFIITFIAIFNLQ